MDNIKGKELDQAIDCATQAIQISEQIILGHPNNSDLLIDLASIIELIKLCREKIYNATLKE